MTRVRKKTAIPKGPTRAQLQAKIDRLERRLQRYEPERQLRKEGEHWYRLVEMFNPHEIKRVPVGDQQAFLMGMLQEAIVVEVPDGTSQEEMVHFSQQLRRAGVSAPPIYIYAGVRFLKLASVDPELEKRLDASASGVLKEEDDEEDPDELGADPADAAGPGPEPAGDGLGDHLPADVEGAGDGGRHHEAADEAGEEAPDGGGG